MRLRRLVAMLAAGALGAVGLSTTSPAARADLKVGGFMSPNVEWLGTLPIDVTGIGGRVVDVEGQKRLYVTSLDGLSIYDLTNPELPLLMGTAVLPHYENEDVDVSADGRTVLISVDLGGPLFIVDASIPQAPVLAGVLLSSAHTVTCADDACDWVYTSEGDIYDLRNKARPVEIPRNWSDGLSISSGPHDLNRDAAGLLTTDSNPRYVLDVTNPTNPVVVGRGATSPSLTMAYQHNNLRPNADQWVRRADGDAWTAGQDLRPGELMWGVGETVFTGRCGASSGPLATWSATAVGSGEIKLQPIDVFRPVNGTLTDGWAPAHPNGCSAHWFSERGGLVAGGWYENGVRFHTADSKGEISELGWFQPGNSAAWAAYWVTDEIVLSVDLNRGIDILRFDRDAPAGSTAAANASWVGATAPSAVSRVEQQRCRIEMELPIGG